MGAGNVGVLMFGFALADNRADVVYGLYERFLGHHVHLPGDTPINRGALQHGMPRSPLGGRHWIGVSVWDLPALPPMLEDAVHPADSQKLEGLVHMPSVSEGKKRRAAEELAIFTAWCERRGVTLGQPGLFVVADYD